MILRERHRLRMADGAWIDADTFGDRRADCTVVLAHGWCLDRTSWDDVTRLLLDGPVGEGVRVVRYDQHGHGRSVAAGARVAAGRGRLTARDGREAVPPSITRLGDDLATVVDHLAPTGRLVLGGHSMGGMTIMAAAGRHPALFDRVDGVLLVSTAADATDLHLPVLPAVIPEPWRTDLLRRAMRVLSTAPALPGACTARALPPSLSRFAPRVALGTTGTARLLFGPDGDRHQVAAVHAMVGRTRLRTLGGYYTHALSRHDEVASLARLADIPTTVLVGELDRLTPPASSEAIAAVLPTSTLVRLPGTGHMAPMERPDAVAEALEKLVRR